MLFIYFIVAYWVLSKYVKESNHPTYIDNSVHIHDNRSVIYLSGFGKTTIGVNDEPS